MPQLRPNGSNYQAWFDAIRAKYPDAYGRTTGEYGWSTLEVGATGPALTPHNDGPMWTDVSARSYSCSHLIGTFDHVSNTGKLFVNLD